LLTVKLLLERKAPKCRAMIHVDFVMKSESAAHQAWPDRRVRLSEGPVKVPEVLHVPVKEKEINSTHESRKKSRKRGAEERGNCI
jgi:hypothetical protein